MLLKQLGWDRCVGYEYSAAAARAARERGLEVVSGPFEETISAIPDQSLDAAVAGYVIEHVTDPYRLTRQLATKLKHGGQFVFSTINIETPDFRLYGPYWHDLDLPRHMVFFRERDLLAMLSGDFKIESIRIDGDVNDYIISANNRRRDGISGWRRLIDLMVLRLGRRLARPIRLLARVGIGSRIFVKARKL